MMNILLPTALVAFFTSLPAAQPAIQENLADDELAPILMLEDYRDPAAALAPLLGHESAAVRRRACLAAGRIGLLDCPDPFRPVLEAILTGDDSAPVRAAAAFALGEAEERESIAVLIAALDDAAPQVRSAAAEALAKLGAEAAVPALVRLLGDDEPLAVRRTVLLSGWRIADPRTAIRAVEIFLGGAEELRLPAAYHLARFGRRVPAESEPLPPIPAELATEMARHGDPEVRKCAARLVGTNATRASLDLLGNLLADADRGVVVQALRAAAARGWAGAAETILRLLAGADDHLRLEAASAAGRVSEPALVDALLERLSDPEPAVAAAAVASLAAINPRLILGRFEFLLLDARPQLRAAAARRLGLAVEARGWGWFDIAMREDRGSVRIAAAEALTEIEGPAADERLLALLEDEDPVIVAIAASGIRRRSAPGSAERLVAAYRRLREDTNFEAKAEVLRGLAACGGAECALAALEEALGDPDRSARVLAASLLREIDGRDRCGGIGPVALDHDLDYYRRAVAAVRRCPEALIRTSRGEITIRFAADEATLTAYNFITLVRSDYFDGIVIHRVVPDFVVQAGCPRGDGWGGPGYSIRCEINSLRYERGAVGMALAGKDTGGSQWFIALAPQPHLDGGYTVFARVVSGMEVADRLMPGDRILDVQLLEENR